MAKTDTNKPHTPETKLLLTPTYQCVLIGFTSLLGFLVSIPMYFYSLPIAIYAYGQLSGVLINPTAVKTIADYLPHLLNFGISGLTLGIASLWGMTKIWRKLGSVGWLYSSHVFKRWFGKV